MKTDAKTVECIQSTLNRELRRNSTDKGNYLRNKAHLERKFIVDFILYCY